MKPHAEYKAERATRDSEYREAYDALEEEYELRRGVIRARIEQGLTQADLAERLGTTQSAISRMEAGEFNPRVDTLRKLAVALGVEFRIASNGSRVVHSKRGGTNSAKRGNGKKSSAA